MRVRPFRGWRPRKDLADRIPSPPYDVLNSEEARRMAEGNPHSFLHVIKPEIDLDPGIDLYDDRVYAKAAENLTRMIDEGWLVRESKPAFYVYRLVMDGRPQTGILGAAAVQDYLDQKIKRHEHTRPQKENDRIRLNEALGANPGPVFLTYRQRPELAEEIGRVVEGRAPDVKFTAPHGVEHALWVVTDEATCAAIEGQFGQVPATYVADGHHRAAAAAKAGVRGLEGVEHPTGDEPYGYFLAVHFPAEELRLLDYNRVVRDLHGLEEATFLERLRQAGFRLDPDHAERRAPRPGTMGMYLAGRWWLVGVDPTSVPQDDPVGRLDVAILTDRLLQPILGIGDPRTDARLDFVGGIRGMDELERRVDSGDWAIAFAMYPTSLDDVMAVADAGVVMPPKSTWFEPKLRSGMVLQKLDGETL